MMVLQFLEMTIKLTGLIFTVVFMVMGVLMDAPEVLLGAIELLLILGRVFLAIKII